MSHPAIYVAVLAKTTDEAAAVSSLSGPEGLVAGRLVLDVSPDASVEAPAGTTRIRGASCSVGDALRAGGDVVGNGILVLRGADHRYDDAQLQAVADTFASNPDVDLVTCSYGLAGSKGVTHVVDPAQDGDQPPPCWHAGLALRGSLLPTMRREAWFPSLLSAYLDAHAAGRLRNLSTPLVSVSQDHFAAVRFAQNVDRHLLHAHGEAFGTDTPWLSVVVATGRSVAEQAPSLETLARQVLPPGTFEVVVVDRGDGSLSQFIETTPAAVPWSATRAPDGPLGAALQAGADAARGQVVLFLDEDAQPYPDLVEQHIRAHHERPGQLLVAVGSQEAPLTELRTPGARAIADTSPLAWVLDTEGVPLHPAHRLDLGNASVPRDAILGAGGIDPTLEHAAGTALGWRLDAQGYEALALPQARTTRPLPSVDAWVERAEAIARDAVGLHAAVPSALDAAELHDATVDGLDALLRDHGASEGVVRHALRGLERGPDLFALEQLGGDWAELSTDLDGRAGKLLTHLQRLAEARGRAAGLRARGVDSYRGLIATQTLPLTGARTTRYLVHPMLDDERGWLGVLARYLIGFGPGDDTTLVLVADPEHGGVPIEELQTAILEMTRRIQPGARGGWADVQVAQASGQDAQLVRLLASVDGWTPTGHDGDARIEALASEVGTPSVDTGEWSLRGTDGIEPWPLATSARFRLLAWPDWSNADELHRLFDVFARPLVNRDDAALVLRYDVGTDGDPTENLNRMAEAYEAALGEGHGLQVLLLDDEPAADSDFHTRLAAASSAWVELASGSTPSRAQMRDELGLPGVTDAMSVTTQLFSMPPMPLGPLYAPTLSLD